MMDRNEVDFGAWQNFCALNSLTGAMVSRFLSSDEATFNVKILEDINTFYDLELDQLSFKEA